jgi:polysaccharide export outer membrane protein
MKTIYLLLLLAVSVVAQQLPNRSSDAQFNENNNLPFYEIGPGDLLGISVYDAPELTRTVRVDSEGMIHLPLLKKGIEVAGLRPARIEEALATELKKEDVLVDPVVTVSVVQYQSRPVTVAGAVKAPLTFQALGPVRLLDALARAGGLSESAGTEIVVLRTHTETNSQAKDLLTRIPVQPLLDGSQPELNIPISGGEEIRVPEAGKVFVVGSVRKPGAFPIKEGAQLSVMKALALSEGLTQFAMSDAYIYRQDGNAHKEIQVKLNQILARKAPDVPLTSNDIFYIPDSKTRHGFAVAMEKALILGSGMGAAAMYSIR